jgi:shikimate kinase
MPRHVVLVGLPGSGKTTVGQLVAEKLGAAVIDIDQLLVREMGMPIGQMFGMVGEVKFRQMERDAVRTARTREGCVIVPGGGWAAQPGELDAARADSLLLYLKCDARVAAKRTEEGAVDRPLLMGVDPEQQIKKLLAEREPYYLLADYVVEVGKVPAEAVAEAVVQHARRYAGWG